jgi:hypothetical protein
MKLRFPLKTLVVIIVLFGLWLGWRKYVEVESASVLRAYHAWMALLEKGNYGAAYLMLTQDYRDSHSLESFTAEFSRYSDPGNPPHDPRASVNSLFRSTAEVYEHEAPDFFELLNGQCYSFRKENGQWRFTGRVATYLD